jgi:hypothetical protein
VAAIMLCSATTATAIDYNGRVSTGVYQSKEEFVEPSAGSVTNDQGKVLASAYLDLTKVGPYGNQITIDFRDKFEQFGAVDEASPRLIASNEPQLRQLAVKYPYMTGDLYWAVGRFPVVDAAVLGNDGAEFGYRVQPRLKLGVFGGLHPEHRDGKTLAVAEEDKQFGAYAVFEERGREWTRNTYVATAVVARQPTIVEAAAAEDEDPAAEPTPEELAALEAEPQDEMFWYTNAVYQPSEARRVSVVSHVDFAPASALRNVWASWQERIQPKVTTRASVFHLDLNEYEKQRDIRDRLPGSTYTQAKVTGRFTVNSNLIFEVDLGQGSRGYDSKSKTEVFAKAVMSRLAGGAVSAFGGAGYRSNFTSQDMVFKGGATFYARSFEVSLTQQYISETHDDGRALHPLITGASIGALLGQQVIASAGVEYAKDEEVTLMSGLFTLGYRFTNAQPTPVRRSSPPVERL